jgi:hypothetical protein
MRCDIPVQLHGRRSSVRAGDGTHPRPGAQVRIAGMQGRVGEAPAATVHSSAGAAISFAVKQPCGRIE